MKVPVEVPALSEALPTMQVGRWHQAAGASVVAGEPLVELITDKIDFTVEAPASGVLADVTPTGTEVRVKDVIAVILPR